MADAIDVPSALWFNRLPQTPTLREVSDEMGFAVVPGRGPLGPTVVLAGRYHVLPPILDYYGGQLPSPIRVVAIDAERGAVYSAELLEGKSPPVFVMVPEGAMPSGGARTQGGSFNVDLQAHLGLPPHAATYHVFLWLDHVLSPVEAIKVAESSQRTPMALSTRSPGQPVLFGARHVLTADPDAVVLRADPTPHPWGVEGVWGPDAARMADHEKPYFLTILAFNHRDRSFGWTAVNVNALPKGTDVGSFQLDAAAVAGASSEPQKVFVLAFAEGKRFKVLTLPAR